MLWYIWVILDVAVCTSFEGNKAQLGDKVFLQQQLANIRGLFVGVKLIPKPTSG